MKNNALTPRELEVMNLIMQGYHNLKISEILCISEHTVKAYLESIYEKLNVSNRVQAIIRYLKDYANARLFDTKK